MPGDGSSPTPDTLRDRPRDRHTASTESAAGPRQRERRPTYEPGTHAGRYVIGTVLGYGGMGVVYRAHDPDLDRDVALKVLRVRDRRSDDANDRARDRLLREAQALAQLAHPNVVAAYDVGSIDGDVFVAMELVTGRTMRQWLDDERPAIPAIIEVLVAAGRGLAAAHRAGLVHRDFKPGNVILGDDGRARVADFGLARAADHDDATLSLDSDPRGLSSSSDRRLSAQLTLAGAVVGTPGYMAPEQLSAGEVGAHADQYSFCATLYEAVYGRRPFEHDDLAELRRMVTSQQVPVPARKDVPTWLRRLILRGLAKAPADRYPSMDALLDELGRDRGRRARAIALAAGAVAVLGAGAAIAVLGAAPDPAPPCQGAAARIDAVWNRGTRAQVVDAFRATGRSHAAASAARVGEVLDDYRDAWVAARTDACEATRVRGEQSEPLMDLRMRCLDARLGELRALTALFATAADGELVDRSVRAAIDISDLSICADAERLAAAYPPPATAELAAQVAALQPELDEAGALYHAGRYDDALARVRAVAADSAPLGYAPLAARALHLQGEVQARAGDVTGALATLSEAARAAAAARDDDQLAAVTLTTFYVLGVLQARSSEALAMADLVDAIVARAGGRPAQRGDAAATRGYLLLRAGDPAAALVLLQAALADFEEAYGADHLRICHPLNYLGMAYNELGRTEDAVAVGERARAIAERQLGPDHPSLIALLNNLGQAYRVAGRNDDALVAVGRALAIAEATLPPEHPKIAIGLQSEAEILVELGRCEEAMPMMQRALGIFEATWGPEHAYVAYPLTGMGQCLVDAGDEGGAVAVLERALRVRMADPKDDSGIALTSFQLARALWSTPRYRRRALELARDARARFDRAGGRHVTGRDAVDEWLRFRQAPGGRR